MADKTTNMNITIEQAENYVFFIDLCVELGDITREYGDEIIENRDWNACDYLMEKFDRTILPNGIQKGEIL